MYVGALLKILIKNCYINVGCAQESKESAEEVMKPFAVMAPKSTYTHRYIHTYTAKCTFVT